MGVSGVSQEVGSGPQQAEGQADHWKRPAPVMPVPAAAQAAALGWGSAQALAQWVSHGMEHLGAAEEEWGWGRGRMFQVGVVVVEDPAAEPTAALDSQISQHWLAYKGS